MRKVKVLLLVAAVAICCGFQQPDDGEEQRIPGQPDTCNNYAASVHKCSCSRAMMACRLPGERPSPDVGENRCLTTCRPKACKCSGPRCTSRHH